MRRTRTPEQIVTNALSELAPARALREQCKSDIEEALIDIEMDGAEPKPYSKNTKGVVRALRASLKKAQLLHDKLKKLDDYGIMWPLDLRERIEFYDEWLAGKPESEHRTSLRQKVAVKEARALVIKYSKNKKKDYSVTRGNKWWKLSAILLGDPDVDLFRHMRALTRPQTVSK